MGHIIAVSGPIGSGKTTLAGGIAAVLGNASILHYDSYERASRQAPNDVIRWISEGADFNAFVLPDLVSDLSALKRGISITDPLSGETTRAEDYIIFEMPLGREHRHTSPLIDLLVWIDIPPDVALARKMREYTEGFLTGGHGRHGLEWLKRYLDTYPAMIRPIMEILHERVRPGADIIIDGRDDPRTQADRAAKEITRLLGSDRH
ncbi:MAG: hypothetical protein M0Q23_07410 [Syntrophales bacterium]|jgi:uridine kinase|nr:hypothetical protein [Syntrophales bacterium]MCK9528451.1 hypothetical protein [Syntrophales bacterium]MDX9922474.1 hypothetical protein [Syntrophales bacterium]